MPGSIGIDPDAGCLSGRVSIQCQSKPEAVRVATSGQNRLVRHRIACRPVPILLLLCVLIASAQDAQKAGKRAEPDANTHPVFVEADAVRLIDELRRALETQNRSRFLKSFDARRMPGYPAFRDQVAEFFGRFDEFQVRYHVQQVTMDGEIGAAVADFEIDATPRDGASPDVRKRVPLRLVCGWDGTHWKIVDLSPRNWLE